MSCFMNITKRNAHEYCILSQRNGNFMQPNKRAAVLHTSMKPDDLSWSGMHPFSWLNSIIHSTSRPDLCAPSETIPNPAQKGREKQGAGGGGHKNDHTPHTYDDDDGRRAANSRANKPGMETHSLTVSSIRLSPFPAARLGLGHDRTLNDRRGRDQREGDDYVTGLFKSTVDDHRQCKTVASTHLRFHRPFHNPQSSNRDRADANRATLPLYISSGQAKPSATVCCFRQDKRPIPSTDRKRSITHHLSMRLGVIHSSKLNDTIIVWCAGGRDVFVAVGRQFNSSPVRQRWAKQVRWQI